MFILVCRKIDVHGAIILADRVRTIQWKRYGLPLELWQVFMTERSLSAVRLTGRAPINNTVTVHVERSYT